MGCVMHDCPCTDVMVCFRPLDSTAEPQWAYANIDYAAARVAPVESNPSLEGIRLARELVDQPQALQDLTYYHLSTRASAAGLDSPFRMRAALLRADERCPCGSRKVYRRCCAQARPPRLDLDLGRRRAEAREVLLDFAAEHIDLNAEREQAIQDFGPDIPEDLITWYLLYALRTPHFTIADRLLVDVPGLDHRVRRYIEAVSGTPIGLYVVGPLTSQSVALTPMLLDHPPLRLLRDKSAKWVDREIVLAVVPEVDARPQVEACWRLGLSADDPICAVVEELVEDHDHHLAVLLDPSELIQDVGVLLGE